MSRARTAELRRRLPGALVVLASVLLFPTVVVGYANRTLFDAGRFADRATATLRDERVRTVVADHVTDGLVLRKAPDLVAARPIIASAVSGIVGSGAFRRLFELSVRDAHLATFERDQDTVTLTLADVGTVVAAALRALQPNVAAQLDRSGEVEVVKGRIGTVTGDLARTARGFHALTLVLALLTLAAAVAAVALSGDRRRTVARLGAGAIAVGILVAIAYLAARAIVVARVRDADDKAAVRAVWDAFLGGLFTLAVLLAAVGTIVAAAPASLIAPGRLDWIGRRLSRLVTEEPRSTGRRVVRALALVAVGVLLMASPLLALQIAAVLLGIALLYAGIDALLRIVHQPGAAQREREARAARRREAPTAVWAMAAVLIAVAVGAFAAGGGVSEPAAATVGRCNGHAQLCDRPLVDVVLPATHNSMSAPLPGWFSTMQERSIGGQLADGIRGLLLDTHYADKLANGNVRTEVGGPDDMRRLIKDDSVSQASIDAALRLRDRLGFQGKGERGIYLCHSFCEIGATPLSDGLRDIHDFLVTNPDEVVVVVNQDYISAADFEAAVRDAGLERFAATLAPGARSPTLREMIESDHRLVLLAENHAGDVPWYELAYDRLLQETPYHFGKATDLTDPATLAASCRPNRGPASAPYFLLNHWVTTDPVPRPSDAAKVNAFGPMLARARECGRIRHRVMNLLAVNFYKEGDLFRVVDTLNGIASRG